MQYEAAEGQKGKPLRRFLAKCGEYEGFCLNLIPVSGKI